MRRPIKRFRLLATSIPYIKFLSLPVEKSAAYVAHKKSKEARLQAVHDAEHSEAETVILRRTITVNVDSPSDGGNSIDRFLENQYTTRKAASRLYWRTSRTRANDDPGSLSVSSDDSIIYVALDVRDVCEECDE